MDAQHLLSLLLLSLAHQSGWTDSAAKPHLRVPMRLFPVFECIVHGPHLCQRIPLSATTPACSNQISISSEYWDYNLAAIVFTGALCNAIDPPQWLINLSAFYWTDNVYMYQSNQIISAVCLSAYFAVLHPPSGYNLVVFSNLAAI